ncbi:MAG: S8 family serine peptidase, partial [Caldilineaceae bacterium]|nr:S8 family serine peptidase [Caldilineaceae bacterium]
MKITLLVGLTAILLVVSFMAQQNRASAQEQTESGTSQLVIEPVTITLDEIVAPGNGGNPEEDFKVTSSVEISAPQAGWETIMSEDAEGAFPEDNGWSVFDDNVNSGDDYWDDVNCRSYAGDWSIWAADAGDMVDCATYDNNMAAWMVYGPFDLSGNVIDAQLDFYYWLDSEASADYFYWLSSGDGANFSGFRASGAGGGWSPASIDLSGHVGDPDVWIAFYFQTNSSGNNYEGAYVDNIVLSKDVVASLAPDIEVDPTSLYFTREAAGSGIAISASRSTQAELKAKVVENGQLPVIVRLTTGFMPEGALGSPQAVNEQRSAIARSQDFLLSNLSGLGVTGVKRFHSMPYVAMTVNAAAMDALQRSPFATSVMEDVAEEPTLDLSIPLINADDAWAAGYTGAGQTVAVLDTGVDSSHPFLSGKVVSEACYSTTNTDSTTLCPNGLDSQTGAGAGVHCTGAGGCSHGTHVAGIVAGNGDTFDGVAPGANVIAIQVFSKFDVDGTLRALSYTSDQMLGLERVYDLRNDFSIAAVNMSLGGGSYTSACDSDPRKAIIDNLRSEGIATVIASGNNGYTSSITAPACISSAISVGATTSHSPADVVAGYSNSAPILDLLAPGSSINSSVPGGGYASWNGTSMATPHVAGSWAVLKSQTPDASIADVFYALESTGVPITDARNGLVKPRIDVYAALLALANYESLTIRNLGYGDLSVINISIIEPVLARTQAKADCAWLVLDAPTTPFTLTPDDSVLLGVTVNVCEGPGIYTKTIRITSDDLDESTVDVPVTLEVNGPLAVTLNWFLAEPNGGMVNFQWETTAEQGVAGFNLLALHDDQTV